MLLSLRRLAFFGGKGGVGKTTLAAAQAVRLAEDGERTLLVSTDPAHSTSDLLGVRLGNAAVQVAERMWAVEVDAQADARAYVERIKRDARDSVSAEVLPAVERHLELALHSPGTIESALLDRMVGLMDSCPGEYDRIVFDTAPTGHTLRLLALPEMLTGVVQGLVRQRERVASTDRMLRNIAGDDRPAEDPVLVRLRSRRDALRGARERLVADAQFWLVCIPERLPIEETARAAAALGETGIHIAALVVNRVLPAGGEDAFMRARLEQEAAYLEEIDRRFSELRRVRVAHRARDVTTREELAAIAGEMAALPA